METCKWCAPGPNPHNLEVYEKVVDEVGTTRERHGTLIWIGAGGVAAALIDKNGNKVFTKLTDLTREKEVNNESKDSK